MGAKEAAALDSIWLEVYFVAENLVLWARSDTIGSAVNCAPSKSGMMESWNVGMMDLVEWDRFL